MSYQVLARKWRPQNFTQMVGQEHVLRALINALDGDRLHHAYLFTGTRGVGKTTIARILAKCLNCEKGVSSTPCGECNSCKEIAAGNLVDLIEVDAASRTKVEDTRELLDNVQYAPTRARFKVYLIDEVHMLTGHSFNALLKTLEEPPPHVKFLFATTDPQKLPATILSRCLQFNLKRMPVDMISGHLQYLLEEESIPFEESSLRLLSRAADGSMRDALSLLDQAIAFGGSEVNETDVREMLGTVSHEPLIALLKSVSAGEGAQLLQQIEDLSGVSPDFAATCDALIALLHQLAVQQVVPDSIQDEDSIEALAQSLTKEEVQLFYQIALQGRGDLALAPDPRCGFEMILLRMMSFRPLRQGMQKKEAEEPIAVEDTSSDEEINKKKTIKSDSNVVDSNTNTNSGKEAELPPWEVLPESLKSASNVSQETTSEKNIESLDISIPQSNHVSEEVSKVSEKSTVEPILANKSNIQWHQVVPKLQLSGRAAELIKHCLLEQQENGIISLKLDKSSEGLLADSIHLEIQTALTTFYGDAYKLELTVADAVNNEEQVDSDIQSPETPAQRSDREKIEIQQQAENNINSDPFVMELRSRFGGQVVPGSVHPK
ncbi:MAG: DNA polymerase III subunit gamma/tau [Cocleimonas sp.]